MVISPVFVKQNGAFSLSEAHEKDKCLKEQFSKERLYELHEAWGEDIIQILIVSRASPSNCKEKGMN